MVSDDLKVKLALAAGAVLLVGGAAWFLQKKAREAAGVAGDVAARVTAAVNPFNHDNIAYTGANAVTREVTGVPDDTLGVALWRLFNPAQSAADEKIAAPLVPWNALDQEDADAGYYRDLARAESPYFGDMGAQVRGSFQRSVNR